MEIFYLYYILGPVTIVDPKKNYYVLIGLVSWGFPDMKNRNATAYLRKVESMLSWIESKITENAVNKI